MSIQRYNIKVPAVPSSAGEWVSYSDHVAAVEAATQLQWSGSAVTDARQQAIRDCIAIAKDLTIVDHFDGVWREQVVREVMGEIVGRLSALLKVDTGEGN